MIAIWDGLDFGSVDNLDYRDYRRRRSFSSTGPSSWSLDASETGGRTKCPWVGVVGLIPLGERAGKIGRLAFTELVAPATATPDWSRTIEFIRAQHIDDNLSDRNWHSSLRGSVQNGIDFRRIFPGDCFDLDRLSAFSPGRSVLKREQKYAVSRSREDVPLVDPFQHRDVFSKELLGEFCQLQPIQKS